MDADKKVHVLLEAFPYIKKFSGQNVVIKYSGLSMLSKSKRKSFISDLTLLKYCGIHPIIVHGGRTFVTRALKIFGKKTSYVGNFRITDQEVVGITEMVLKGYIGTTISTALNYNGVKAIAISGRDGSMIKASPLDFKLGYVGKADKIDKSIIDLLLNEDYVPVISPIATGYDNKAYSLLADDLVVDIGVSCSCNKMIIVSDVDGIFTDPSDPYSLMSKMTAKEARDLIDRGVITRGMVNKVESCISALSRGVQECHIINGNRNHALLIELLTDEGIGTMITN